MCMSKQAGSSGTFFLAGSRCVWAIEWIWSDPFAPDFKMCMSKRADLEENFFLQVYDVYEQTSGLRRQTSGVKRIIHFL